MFGPLKYTRFRRNERFCCISAQFSGSMLSCVVLNFYIPGLGPLVLGLFGSFCSEVTVSFFEAILRRVQWKQAVLMEDIRWYKGKCISAI